MGVGGLGSWMSALFGSTDVPAAQDTVAIRVINQTSAVLTLEVLVDNERQTYTCSSQGVYEFQLGRCPEVVEAVSEREFEPDGTFLGGRDFTGSAAFRLTRDDFECGETIIFRFTESSAEVMVL
jgi:hypothetical protein